MNYHIQLLEIPQIFKAVPNFVHQFGPYIKIEYLIK